MEKNPKSIILKVLEIIGYNGDKNAVVDKFMVTCQQQANVDLIKALSDEKQEELKQKLSEPGVTEDVAKIQDVIQSFFSPEEYTTAIEKTSAGIFNAYMDKLVKDLPENQQSQLQKYFKSLAQ